MNRTPSGGHTPSLGGGNSVVGGIVEFPLGVVTGSSVT